VFIRHRGGDATLGWALFLLKHMSYQNNANKKTDMYVMQYYRHTFDWGLTAVNACHTSLSSHLQSADCNTYTQPHDGGTQLNILN